MFDLTRCAVEACRPFELLDRWAVVLVVEMMFLFGARFLDDPLYAWAPAALRESPGADIDQRLARLLAAAQAAIAPRL